MGPLSLPWSPAKILTALHLSEFKVGLPIASDRVQGGVTDSFGSTLSTPLPTHVLLCHDHIRTLQVPIAVIKLFILLFIYLILLFIQNLYYDNIYILLVLFGRIEILN